MKPLMTNGCTIADAGVEEVVAAQRRQRGDGPFCGGGRHC